MQGQFGLTKNGDFCMKYNIDKIIEKVAYGFLMLGILGVLYSSYLLTHQDEIEKNSRLAAILSGSENIIELNLRTKEVNCEARGPLPDSDCTPGDIFPEVTKDEICVSGYSKTVRNVSQGLKKKVFAQYGISYPVPFGSYEVDHLIPLSLGGSNDISNLWPKSAEPFPGFYEKNITGNYLREEVCADNIDLSIAQKQIANNWFLIYENLDQIKIQELKNKYKNWAE